MKQLTDNRQLIILIVGVLLMINSCSKSSAEVSGELKEWHKVSLSFTGPESGEQDTINPFLNYRLNVTFTIGEQTIVVPGYYAADGKSGQTSSKAGNIWRCHFRPTTKGIWTWKASFREGDTIAINEFPDAGKSAAFDGETGSFEIIASDKIGPDFKAKGLLQYAGEHYFQFAGSKEYYIKGGADSPENLLAYKDFDDTHDADAGSGSYEHIGSFIHEYKPHNMDWKSGDPTWKSSKGKGLIGGLNYLASKGMNSVYFLTYNLDGGDGRDVWMWSDYDERERFDCSKLDQWEIIFDHMEKLGIMMHVVTQETENDHKLGGSAGLNRVRKLYYRELIARYGHHLALIWNLGEENKTPDADRKEIASFIRTLDPYNHPITVHTHPNVAFKFYNNLLGNENFEATSIQSKFEIHHGEVLDLRKRTAEAGRKWAIFYDEQVPATIGVLPDADDPMHDQARKEGLWGNLMGGGAGVEWYFGQQYPHMDINCEDWRSRDKMWDQTRYALNFFNNYIPFWEMAPADQLTSTEDDYCFAKEGEVYAIFLSNGGTTRLDLRNFNSEFEIKWYNPRTDGSLINGSLKTTKGGNLTEIGTAPDSQDKDWVVLIKKI